MIFINRILRKSRKVIEKSKLPAHLAIIPDGNGRWATRQGLPRNVGHREGANTLKRIVKKCSEIGIKYLSVYVFSTENWSRPKSEVDALMELLTEFLKRADTELTGSNIRIRIIGDIKKLSPELRDEIVRVTESTKNQTGLNLIFALNYGGRDEILQAVTKIACDVHSGALRLKDINDRIFSDKLYTSGIPDPDLLIRTSGEMRTSNFLLWQTAYTELWYSDTLWPDFSEDELLKAVYEYQGRNRRFGGI